MSSGESESSAPAGVISATIGGSSHETAANIMLTDSENTNNENRVIEMESNASSGGDDDLPQHSAEPRENPAASELSGERVTGEDKVDNRKDDGKEDLPKTAEQDQYAEHVTYNAAGEAIYTDPATKCQYRWCKEKSEWTALEGAETATESDKPESDNPFENEHYRWCHEKQKWIPKQANTDETEFYRWDKATQKWIPKEQTKEKAGEREEKKENREYGYEDGVHTYFWDDQRKAWFPKIDDDFMAMYQLNYGFVDNTSGATSDSGDGPQMSSSIARTIASDSSARDNTLEASSEEQEEAQRAAKVKKRKAPPEPPKWFDLAPEHNTKVYVSNLPTDISEEEFGEVMSKCGMVMKDPKTHKLKLKLYCEPDGTLKGDGLCHYIKIESVDLAVKILDNYDVRGHKIKVQPAEFQMRGEYNPTLKPKMRKKEKERLRKMQESLFDWRPEKMRGERSKHERIVIIKNLFEPELFDREVHLLLEYQTDLREECGKCGTVRRVVLYDRHPEGVAQVTMGDPEEADLVVQLLNGRFFGQRKLEATIWDGRTKYRIAETDADIDKRRGNWEQYLETGEKAATEAGEKDNDEEDEDEKDKKEGSSLPRAKDETKVDGTATTTVDETTTPAGAETNVTQPEMKSDREGQLPVGESSTTGGEDGKDDTDQPI
ncbi:HIV Tat-specific factor 1 homolog [Anopheles nili]|uniref:HIV Tat-specific factor 1 homolog n=1 Tax=Anopheles nili TaxID=185578 RepID=UPI00237AD66C|nr:HIV Tat-specific factor 1 homolog [Anopheles nili]